MWNCIFCSIQMKVVTQPRHHEYRKAIRSHLMPAVYTNSHCNMVLSSKVEYVRSLACLKLLSLHTYIHTFGYIRLHIAGSTYEIAERRPWSSVTVQQPAWKLRTSIYTTTSTTHSSWLHNMLSEYATYERRSQYQPDAPNALKPLLAGSSGSAGGF